VLFDRRTAHRIIYETPARLQWHGHDLAATSRNLSTDGIACRLPRVEALQVPPAGTPAQITLALDGTLATLAARVKWHRVEDDDLVLGLLFQPLSSHHQSLLSTVVGSVRNPV